MRCCCAAAGIERLIEVNESSSIFVRVDEDNTFLWRALITGGGTGPGWARARVGQGQGPSQGLVGIVSGVHCLLTDIRYAVQATIGLCGWLRTPSFCGRQGACLHAGSEGWFAKESSSRFVGADWTHAAGSCVEGIVRRWVRNRVALSAHCLKFPSLLAGETSQEPPAPQHAQRAGWAQPTGHRDPRGETAFYVSL